MSLLLNFYNARKRRFDSAEAESAETESHDSDSPDLDSQNLDAQDLDAHDNIFELTPPARGTADPEPGTAQSETSAPAGRNLHQVEMTDLARLSIDNDGRLYWDGKPVEVHRRLLMSRQQIIGALVIGAFVAVGAFGAVLQGTSAARDWACRLGWATSVCGPPSMPRNAFDIPA